MDDPKIQPTGDKSPHEIPLDQLAGDQNPEQPTPPTQPAPPAAPQKTPPPPSERPPQAPPQEVPQAQPQKTSQEPPQKPPQSPTPEPSPEDPKKKNLFKFIIIGISIVILLAVGYLVYGFLSEDRQPVEAPPPDPSFAPPEEDIEMEDVINDLKEIYEVDEAPPGIHFDFPEMDEEIIEDDYPEEPEEPEEPEDEEEDWEEEEIREIPEPVTPEPIERIPR